MELKFCAYGTENKEWIKVGVVEFFNDGSFLLNEELPSHFQGKEVWVLRLYADHEDINGVEIYDGDVIKHTATTGDKEGQVFINTIEWHKENGLVGFKVIGKDRRCRYGLCRNLIYNHKIEVIGRNFVIFQNHEPLQGK